MHLSLLYRGRLSSCNYSCDYCPFAKTYDSAAALRRDAQELARFVAWAQTRPLSILFTPWGEGLVRRHYREAMVQLSQLPQLRRVAIQTNLCVGLRWLDAANLDRLALWCTYHPSQVTRAAFLQRCQALRERGVRHSVGMVAAHAHMDEIEALRAALPDTTPMWLNAFDPRPPDYYTPEQVQRLSRIDPHFGYNLTPPPSFGAPCLTGESVLSVDGDGTVRRCHFVDAPLGNLYDGSFAAQLRTRSCPNTRCDCFIGYAHRPDLPFQADYAGGVLERVPATA
ncbi:STM4011 family radical SAM protein [Xanthomonas phaseoli]|uniref:Radical SAM protein n=1 Tax=Xanthomonas phaseoli pv. dieffenbachiae TaxID=92828 RepID=A0A1V9HDY4_9XANT|nr:STM4011 family radical SAM protein [Xanthomonas phaseoli]MBO9790264.1 radical SAM protein [Xanthomonas phaseoli pv. dieffenbachiae]MBO9885507.1 radical SAM protein [Xanthomonas phaseoli pv. dieffenbachiae]MBO9916627.1 radical SAM protein [Xanthomonas phaseoli pv. dieffenbachiae]MBO9940752.1 radical SAM protein [Xanthomonas phaseoli pv. dieffenbachiae]MBO9997349.1 radical SAM protein [Xanthomonas phaseoli pv. dieffenbachiae]